MLLINSSVRCEQVKRKVVFDYAEHQQDVGNSFLYVGLKVGAFVSKLFWQN